MKFRDWKYLPLWMQIPEVKEYYDILKYKKIQLRLKRLFDIILSAFAILLLIPVFFIISCAIVIDSRGGIFFRQERVTTYGRVFRIHKFRTMYKGAETEGSILAKDKDSRVTKVGAFLRAHRLDELPQLFDVLKGDMSFVGPRPQSVYFVKHFNREARAVFLMPAGITSETTLKYLHEGEMLKDEEDIDDAYIRKILPEKMKMQLEEMSRFSIINDIKAIKNTI
ncbi:Sugar transferase involved in LPS biosynthesis (colanic, teichoic acid) [Eubacterium ruminantium]|nr:Sugar transferase involved in LPS biosynthesis (colanic, teichoic acid) [Eubacterium ruminantium]